MEATYEKRSNVLERIKKGFESAQGWADAVMCLARYGSSFMSLSISYGTDFFTLTVDSLQKRYAEAKAEGASASELESIRRQIMEAEYRNDPQQRQRLFVLREVEPYPGLSRNDVLNLWEKGRTDEATLELKMGFDSYVSRFERENDNITEFAVAVPFRERIDTIKQTLYSYAEETVRERADAPNAGDLSGTGE